MSRESFTKILLPFVLPLVLVGCGQSDARIQQGFGRTTSASKVDIRLPSFSALVKKEGPAVVNISTTQTVTARPLMPFEPDLPDLDPDDPLYDFFRHFGIPQPPGPQEYKTQSLGSGFIISQDGYILTNAHVIGNADEITVKLSDGRELPGKVIGQDKVTDVALLKINANGLPVVPLGNSDKVHVGDWVVAIGSPFGFEHTVTAGIVSAKRRILPGETYVPFLQTDVAVNPGNSGGPLFNLQGQVIGINAQIYSQTGGYQGLSFAIPIQLAMNIAQQLRETGHVSRGRIGVQIQEVTSDLAKSFGLERPTGALVAAVEPGSPADEAGIKPGDVILEYNGQKVENMGELPSMVASTKPGTMVELEILHNGERKTLKLAVGEFGGQQVAVGGPGPLGLVVSPLSPAQQEQAGVDHGLLVERAQGAAAEAGIQRGDIILAVNNNQIEGIDQFKKLLKNHRGDTVALLVQRNGNALYVSVPMKG